MYVSASMAGVKNLGVKVDPATEYSQVDGIYADRPAPDHMWLKIEGGIDILAIRLTRAQADRICFALGVALREGDAKVAELPERDHTRPVDTIPCDGVPDGILAIDESAGSGEDMGG